MKPTTLVQIRLDAHADGGEIQSSLILDTRTLAVTAVDVCITYDDGRPPVERRYIPQFPEPKIKPDGTKTKVQKRNKCNKDGSGWSWIYRVPLLLQT